MKSYCPSFETFHLKRNKLKQLETKNKKTVGEQLQELNDRAVSLNPNGISGIYAFHSKGNDMIYIGSAKSIKERYNSHIKDLRNNEHVNWKFQLIYFKYGIENLSFYVIEFCPADKCKERESFYIHDLLPEINIASTTPGASVNSGIRGLLFRLLMIAKHYISGSTFEEDYTGYIKKVQTAQDEWHQTQEGFEWIRKRVSNWFSDSNKREVLRYDMKNLWNRLDSQKISDSEKTEQVLKVYKHFLPEKYWTELQLKKFISKKIPNKKQHQITSDLQTSHWLKQCDMYLSNYQLSDEQRRTLETIRR